MFRNLWFFPIAQKHEGFVNINGILIFYIYLKNTFNIPCLNWFCRKIWLFSWVEQETQNISEGIYEIEFCTGAISQKKCVWSLVRKYQNCRLKKAKNRGNSAKIKCSQKKVEASFMYAGVFSHAFLFCESKKCGRYLQISKIQKGKNWLLQASKSRRKFFCLEIKEMKE